MIILRTTGKVDAGIGSVSGTGVGPDWRGKSVVVGITNNGAGQYRLFADSEMLTEGGYSGAAAANALRLGALNPESGTAAVFFGGSIKKIIAGREHLTLARYLQIRAALLA